PPLFRSSGLIRHHAPGQRKRFRAVPTTDHPDLQSTAAAMLDQPEDQRRLAGAAHRDVAHHDDRYRRTIAIGAACEKTLAPGCSHAAIERFQRRQQAQQGMAPIPGPLQTVGEGHQGAACASTVVMRKCAKPSLPAASMAVITAWCGVLPSALMIIGRVRSPADSLFRAAISVSRSCFTSALPLSV